MDSAIYRDKKHTFVSTYMNRYSEYNTLSEFSNSKIDLLSITLLQNRPRYQQKEIE